MAQITRPTKPSSGSSSYIPDTPIMANEVDADLDTAYGAINVLDGTNVLPGTLTDASFQPGTITIQALALGASIAASTVAAFEGTRDIPPSVSPFVEELLVEVPWTSRGGGVLAAVSCGGSTVPGTPTATVTARLHMKLDGTGTDGTELAELVGALTRDGQGRGLTMAWLHPFVATAGARRLACTMSASGAPFRVRWVSLLVVEFA